MADYATHYYIDGHWETEWHANEDKARNFAAKLVEEGTAKEVFVSVEFTRAYNSEVSFEEID